MGKTTSFLPPMAGNGKFIPPIYGNLGDGVLLLFIVFPHYFCFVSEMIWAYLNMGKLEVFTCIYQQKW